MTNLRKSLSLVAIILLLAVVAQAQNTPYSTEDFSATFVGPVTALPVDRNNQNTSSQKMYTAEAPGFAQIVSVRNVDAGIDLSQASVDFYASQATVGGFTLISRRDGVYNGHLSTYVKAYKTEADGSQTIRRVWYILVTTHEVVILMQANPSTSTAGENVWGSFTDSLVIK